jgi:chlorobactene glucosyltransferase
MKFHLNGGGSVHSPWGLDQQIGFGIALLWGIFFILARLHYLRLPKLGPVQQTSLPDCMVVIPARNEADVIGRVVKSLPHDTVIVVDDGSQDGTADVARKSGAGVIPAPPLPQGAVGKANACGEGARHLTSKWILFADADTWFEPGFLNAAVACAEASGLAFLSVYPRIESATWAERILTPYAAALYFGGLSVHTDATAIFNGQCVLVRRDAYEFVGSHGAVLNTITDDVKLAALARRHRLKFATVRADGLAHVRLREPSVAFKRAALRFMAIASWMGMLVMLAGTLGVVWLPVLAWMLLAGHSISAIAFGLWPVVLATPWYRNPLRALLVPLAIYGMIPILWGGMVGALGGARVEWKGRVI